MNSLERFMNTIERKPVDRPACWLGIPDINSLPELMKYFNVNTLHDLKLAVGDDIYTVEVPYHQRSTQPLTGIETAMWMRSTGH